MPGECFGEKPPLGGMETSTLSSTQQQTVSTTGRKERLSPGSFSKIQKPSPSSLNTYWLLVALQFHIY